MSTQSSSPANPGSATASSAAVNAKSGQTPNTRSGKIARLPSHVQEDLNHRLKDHQTARVILPWLNALPEVKTLLEAAFRSKPVNEQNLSNWRRGGFQEWQHRQKYFACFRNVARDAADIESTVGNLTEHAARLLALQFSMFICPPVILRGHPNVPDVPPTIINNFCKIARAISSLRHGDHAAARLKLQEQKQKQPPSPAPIVTQSPPPTEHRAPCTAHPSPPPPLKVNQAKSSLSPAPTSPAPPPPRPPRDLTFILNLTPPPGANSRMKHPVCPPEAEEAPLDTGLPCSKTSRQAQPFRVNARRSSS